MATFYWYTPTCFSSNSLELVTEVMKTHTDSHASFLRQRFNDSLMDVRQALAMFKGASSNTAPPLNDHCAQLYTTMRTQLENSATSLQVWLRRFKKSLWKLIHCVLHSLAILNFRTRNLLD